MTTIPNSGRFKKKHILAAVLPSVGVFTSAEVLRMVEATGLSYDAARQNVYRAKSGEHIWCTENLQLFRKEGLFASPTFASSPAFLPAVIEKLTKPRPGLARCLKALQHKEVLLVSQAARLIASPVDANTQRTYPSLEDELKALLDFPFLKRDGEAGPLDRLILTKLGDPRREKVLAQRAMARNFLEQKLVAVLRHHFAVQNLIAWRAVEREDGGKFNNYPFSGFSFSYLRPLLRTVAKDARPRPMPIVFDVYSGRIGIEVVQGFIERIARAGYNQTRGFPILGVIAAQDFYPDAWSAAKREGLICINLEQLFGREGFQVLVMAENILSQLPLENEQPVTTNEFNELADLIHELKTNPFFTELRGLAFETSASAILSASGWEGVWMDVKAPADHLGEGVTRQVDVTASRNGGSEVIIVECKGETSDKKLDGAYIRKFYQETVPALLKDLKARSRCEIQEVYAQIWTTGVVDDDARNELAALKLKPNIKRGLYDLRALRDELPPSHAPLKRLFSVLSMDGFAESSSSKPDEAKALGSSNPFRDSSLVRTSATAPAVRRLLMSPPERNHDA